MLPELRCSCVAAFPHKILGQSLTIRAGLEESNGFIGAVCES